ncbi:hypothetical protein ES676_06550 [Bizionia saleffrena]|uniref:Tetratricopeptide repeat protein n=1 Tax=Bizionia saleffrena TaxID=291189 RepID=A0A8H2QJQ1_9FLAO|nr:hypothetical protein [Bizionia saleffrena]TYB76108.1 hypothetical protein ES676_06550 [Bizionia saleffrena]
MEEKDYILFENYLQRDLSASDVLAFENRLAIDTAFKHSFITYKELSGYLEQTLDEESSDFKRNLMHISEAHFNTIQTEQPKAFRKRFNIARLAIAASVVVLIGLFLFKQLKTPTYKDFNTHETIDLTVRGGSVRDLVEVTKAFNNREFSKANTILERLLKTDSENRQLQLYYAITNIELNRFETADALLIAISKSESVYKNRALWYHALSNLKQGKTEVTQSLLKQINEEADDYEQAQKLLNKLE